MFHRCDSCSHLFDNATELFEHIQESCLSYYKMNPESWTKILGSLSPDEEKEKKKAQAAEPVFNEAKTMWSPGASMPSTSRNPLTMDVTEDIYECNTCKIKFNEYEDYIIHVKQCCLKKEPPFCIMFRAQKQEASEQPRNVHMTVAEYFYSAVAGRTLKQKKILRRNNCYSCGKTLRNNIRFMSHIRHKVVNEWEKSKCAEDFNMCNHCFRHYYSPFQLQCHLETVHGSEPASCTCQICELHFSSERVFLFHMKDKHVHNEMPYICKLCDYRSSFYTDITRHFRDVHTDTSALMCPFCLVIQHSTNAFLKHALQHIKKAVDCHRCRLQFINARDRMVHLNNDHGSNVSRFKEKKFKNLKYSQVFVRVSSLPSSTNKVKRKKGNLPSENKNRSSQYSPGNTSPINSDLDLPAYLYPLKRSSKFKKVWLPDSEKSYKCMECKEIIGTNTKDFARHFMDTFECRWCVYVTSCKKASNLHVFQEHSDSEIRQHFTDSSKNEPETFPITLDDDSSDDAYSKRVKHEPDFHEINSKDVRMRVKFPPKEYVKRKSSEQSQLDLKKRRKQQNPTKLAEEGTSTSRLRKQKLDLASGKNHDVLHPTPIQVQYKRPGVKIQLPKEQRLSKTARRRKVLAPEGFFPDLDDDKGWAKYFEQCDDAPSSSKKNKTKDHSLPTMVPPNSVSSQMLNPFIPPLQLIKSKKSEVSNTVSHAQTLPHPGPQVATASTTVHKVNAVELNPLLPLPKTILNSLMKMSSNSGSLKDATPGQVYQFKLVQGNPATMPIVPMTSMLKQPYLSVSSSNPSLQSTLPPLSHTPIISNMIPITTASIISPSIKLNTKLPKCDNSIVPMAPVKLRCLAVSHSSLLIRWDPPSNSNVTHYKVIFQGSGAPTVQLLPPEQTLVRLVGLKSDTMYIIRVYALNKNATSPYAFIFQRTKKLRQPSEKNKVRPSRNVSTILLEDKNKPEPTTNKSCDDVIMVIDDNSPTADVTTIAKTKLAKRAEKEISDATKTFSDDCSKTDIQTRPRPVQRKIDEKDLHEKVELPPEAGNPKDIEIGHEVKVHLMEEKTKKKILIEELLKGMKKVKENKLKNKRKQNKDSIVQKIISDPSSDNKLFESTSQGLINHIKDDTSDAEDNIESKGSHSNKKSDYHHENGAKSIDSHLTLDDLDSEKVRANDKTEKEESLLFGNKPENDGDSTSPENGFCGFSAKTMEIQAGNPEIGAINGTDEEYVEEPMENLISPSVLDKVMMGPTKKPVACEVISSQIVSKQRKLLPKIFSSHAILPVTHSQTIAVMPKRRITIPVTVYVSTKLAQSDDTRSETLPNTIQVTSVKSTQPNISIPRENRQDNYDGNVTLLNVVSLSRGVVSSNLPVKCSVIESTAKTTQLEENPEVVVSVNEPIEQAKTLEKNFNEEIFEDNSGEENMNTKKTLENDVTKAMDGLQNELAVIGETELPISGCINGPTLDDIKDIMEDEMAWL